MAHSITLARAGINPRATLAAGQNSCHSKLIEEAQQMLLRGLSMLILFQLLGTAINVLFLPMLPGPIWGFVLMFVYLLLRGGVSENINLASSSLLKYLPLLLT